MSCPRDKKQEIRPPSNKAPTPTCWSARLLHENLFETTNSKCARRAAVHALEAPTLLHSHSRASSSVALGSLRVEDDLFGSLPDSLFNHISFAMDLLLGEDPATAISKARDSNNSTRLSPVARRWATHVVEFVSL